MQFTGNRISDTVLNQEVIEGIENIVQQLDGDIKEFRKKTETSLALLQNVLAQFKKSPVEKNKSVGINNNGSRLKKRKVLVLFDELVKEHASADTLMGNAFRSAVPKISTPSAADCAKENDSESSCESQNELITFNSGK